MPGSAVPLPGPAQRRARRPRRRPGRPLRRAVHGAFAAPAGAGQGPREAQSLWGPLIGWRGSWSNVRAAGEHQLPSPLRTPAFAPSPLGPRSPERLAAGAVEMKREEGARRDAIGRNHKEARLLMFHVDHTAAPSSRTPCRGGSAAVLLCLALLLTALALTSPAEAKKVPKGFFGIAPGVAHLDLRTTRRCGRPRSRPAASGSSGRVSSPSGGSPSGAGSTLKVSALAKNGITPILMIWGAPEWATGSVNPGVPP